MDTFILTNSTNYNIFSDSVEYFLIEYKGISCLKGENIPVTGNVLAKAGHLLVDIL